MENKGCSICSEDFEMNYQQWVRDILAHNFGPLCEKHEKQSHEPNPYLSMIKTGNVPESKEDK